MALHICIWTHAAALERQQECVLDDRWLILLCKLSKTVNVNWFKSNKMFKSNILNDDFFIHNNK